MGERGPAVVGIDIGSTSTKVALVVLERGLPRELAVMAAPTPTTADGLVATIFRQLTELAALGGPRPDAVGITSMAETGVPVDGAGRAITELLRWDRARNTSVADSLVSQLGAGALFAATGVPPGPKAPLCTWLWLSREHPEVFHSMAHWAGVADFVALALTGRLATDHTLAGRTMAYRLPAVGDPLPEGFDPALLAAAGMRPEQLPQLVAPGHPVGRVTTAAAASTGLQAGVPVVISGHDHAVGAWAAGMRERGESADSIGTTEAVLTIPSHAPSRGRVEASGMSIVRTVDGEQEALLGGSPSAGSLVRWWKDNHLDGTSLEAILAALAAAPRERSDLIVLPYLRGRQCPAPDPSATFRILASPERNLEQKTRGLFEALAFQARWIYDEQRRLSHENTRGRAVYVLGAAVAANSWWAAVKATAMPVPVRVVDVREPVATGAALLAGTRTGVLGAVPPLPGHEVSPLPIDLDEAYASFLSAATR